jgi:hypothetical protein
VSLLRRYAGLLRPFGDGDRRDRRLVLPFARLRRRYASLLRVYADLDRPDANLLRRYVNLDRPYLCLRARDGEVVVFSTKVDRLYRRFDRPYGRGVRRFVEVAAHYRRFERNDGSVGAIDTRGGKDSVSGEAINLHGEGILSLVVAPNASVASSEMDGEACFVSGVRYFRDVGASDARVGRERLSLAGSKTQVVATDVREAGFILRVVREKLSIAGSKTRVAAKKLRGAGSFHRVGTKGLRVAGSKTGVGAKKLRGAGSFDRVGTKGLRVADSKTGVEAKETFVARSIVLVETDDGPGVGALPADDRTASCDLSPFPRLRRPYPRDSAPVGWARRASWLIRPRNLAGAETDTITHPAH